jgi:2-haloacid dehalogenase
MTLDFSRFEFLSFDCYGTLIDWETGILSALRPVLEAHGIQTTDDAILHLYAEFESWAEQGAYRPYRAVLEQVVRDFGARMGFEPTPTERQALAESLPQWQPFPDTVPALRQLAGRYRLAIISNVDDDLFAATAVHLQVPFADVITAQQAGSYKPSQHNFRLALKRLSVTADRLLHVAQSLHHDIAPAKALGIANVWINRREGRSGFGATPPSPIRPDCSFTNLKLLTNKVL